MSFVRNRKATDELATELKRAQALRSLADAAAARAREMAPVLTGDYKNSIEVVEGPDGPVLVAKDWKALLIEFGTVKEPPVAPLRRSIAAVGLKLEEKRK